MQGLLRVAAAVPPLVLGDVAANTEETIRKLEEAKEQHASLVVFPELSLTGYTMGDLFFQQSLWRDVEDGVAQLLETCPEGMIAVVGLPVRVGSGLYNCALVLSRGRLWGLVPKTYLPNYNEFYEKRWFQSGAALPSAGMEVTMCGQLVPVGTGLLFRSADGVCFGAELCEDLWAPLPPSTHLALAGAQVIVNLSASNELITKREYRTNLVLSQSARCQCAYVYVSAGTGESSSDLVFSGHSIVASTGSLLTQSADWLTKETLLVTDVDLDRIDADRAEQTSFSDCAQVTLGAGSVPGMFHASNPGQSLRKERTAYEMRSLDLTLYLSDEITPLLHVAKHPFIPSDEKNREMRCAQIFAMQAHALARRLSVTGGKVVVGISGGLDSTLALLAACEAADLLKVPRTNIIGVTMPCFGTTDRTYRNAWELMRTLGVSAREVPIRDAVMQHFQDIGHDPADHSVTYENAQARERTQVLMDIANKEGAIVLGTGDLSEIALGWCTFNADHMSMYGVNSGVPKTLVRWIIHTAAEEAQYEGSRSVLRDILDTPISPELLPPDEAGNILQETEDIVGPYELHDFFLYYFVRFGFSPKKIFDLCTLAFAGSYDRETILKWLKNFYRRFFTQQFKRNCIPDGVKIGSVALSPRGDWRMPSDAVSRAWLKECGKLT